MPEEIMKYLDPTSTPEERAEDLLYRMCLEEKLGQLQCFNPAAWSKDDLKRDYPNGAGEVSFLAASEMHTKEQAAEALEKIQREIMSLSEHHIPAIFHMETLCGAMMPEATSFPPGIGQASTWDPELQKNMAGTIRCEIRPVGITQAFAPVLDISRDPRFGRQGESYGEDPSLATAMGIAYVRGMQADGDLKNGVMATSKHFLGYMNSQGGIHAATCDIPVRALREVYAKPFQAAITEGGLRSVMNCYSTINGEPAAGSKSLLTGLLRNEMGFKGLTVSDYSSIAEMSGRQKVCRNSAEAGKRALEAGMDVELPSKECYGSGLMELIRDGLLDTTFLDRSVRNILKAKFELGLFENPYPAQRSVIDEAFHRKEAGELSLKMAKESLVLLKNDGLLPLKRNVKKIAVIGHHAASTRALFGGYSFISMAETALGAGNTMAGVKVGTASDPQESGHADNEGVDAGSGCRYYPDGRRYYTGSGIQVESPETENFVKKLYPNAKNLLEQLAIECPDAEILYSYGYPYAGNDATKHAEALQIAKDADVVIITLGGKHGWGTTSTTGEGIDSTSINLPKCQEEFIEKLAALGKPTVAVHFDGRPISSDAADKHINSIIEAWSPGEKGAEAIVSVIFGSYNPGGRLPVSIAYNAGQIPVFYGHDNGSGYDVGTLSAFVDYADLPHKPRYCFGHGLSYTTFEYSELRINKNKLSPSEVLEVSVNIENTGKLVGDEVVQLYVSDRYASMVRPVKELAGFRRMTLAPGEKKTVVFKMKISQFAFLDADMRWKVEAGDMDLFVGASSEDIRLRGSFSLSADAYTDGRERGFCAEAHIAASARDRAIPLNKSSVPGGWCGEIMEDT